VNRESVRSKNVRFWKFWIKWKRAFHLLYLKLLRLRGNPEKVAGGTAIGVFIGMTPTVPLQAILAVSIAFLLKKSKLAAAAGVWIANPFSLPFIYLFDYKVGQAIIGKSAPSPELANFSISHLMKLSWEISLPMLIGGLVMGLIFSIPSFFITRRVIFLYRNKRQKVVKKIDFSPKKA